MASGTTTIATCSSSGNYNLNNNGSFSAYMSSAGSLPANSKITQMRCIFWANANSASGVATDGSAQVSISYEGWSGTVYISGKSASAHVAILSGGNSTHVSSNGQIYISGSATLRFREGNISIQITYEDIVPPYTNCSAPITVVLTTTIGSNGLQNSPMKNVPYYLQWSGAQDGNYNPVASYKIEYKIGNGNWTQATTTTDTNIAIIPPYRPAKGETCYYRVYSIGQQADYSSGASIVASLSRSITPSSINLVAHTEKNTINTTSLYVNKGYNNYTFSWSGGSIEGCDVSKYLFSVNGGAPEELSDTTKTYTTAIEEDSYFTIQTVLDDIDNTVSEPSSPVYIYPVSMSRGPVITLTNQVGLWNSVSPIVKESADFTWSEPNIINKNGLEESISYIINNDETITTTSKTISQNNGTSLSFSVQAKVATPYGLEVVSPITTYPTIYYAALFNTDGLVLQGATSGYTVNSRVLSWTYTPNDYGGDIKRIVVQKNDGSTYQIFTELTGNNCVIDFSSLTGGESISIKIQFIDEYGYSTTTEVFTITRLEAPSITLDTISVEGSPTTSAQITITVGKPASVASWSDIGYEFGIRRENIEKVLLSSTFIGFQSPTGTGDSAKTIYNVNLVFSNVKSISNIADAILNNNYGRIDAIFFARAFDKNYAEDTKTESNKTITLDYRGSISTPTIVKNDTLSSAGSPTSLSDIVLNLTKGIYSNIEGTQGGTLDVALVRDGVSLTTIDVASYSFTLPIFSSDTTQLYTYTNTHIYADGSKVSSNSSLRLDCKRWTAPSCSVPVLSLLEDGTGEAIIRVENFNTSINCLSSTTPHFSVKIEIMDSQGTSLLTQVYDVADTYSSQQFDNLSITNFREDKIVQIKVSVIATNGKTLTYTFPQMILRAAGVPFAIRKGGIGINIGQSEDITSADAPIRAIGNNGISTILTLAANNTSQTQIEMTKDTQKMILCFNAETGAFEIKFE